MTTPDLARVLCVDDEPNVLDGLTRNLRRHFQVVTAVGAPAALEVLGREASFAVVVSDLRMPGMDGVSFLARVRESAPDTVRVLLTGQADLAAAIAAVNEGNIFRFLSKPCPPELLLPALSAAAEQHRLITAERVLLEQTLHGSIKTLTDILALASPAAFGRATRAKQHVSALADLLAVPDRWQVEVAAMLSQIGCVTLPPETAEKLYHGQPLSEAERAMTDRLPELAVQLLANIPRLEPVREILVYHHKHFDGSGSPRDGVRGDQLPWGARALKIILDLDTLEAQGVRTGFAFDTLRGRAGWYDPVLVEALAEMLASAAPAVEVRELRLREVKAGMVFGEDVTTASGLLLIARGQEVTAGLLGRIHNFSKTLGVREPIRMILAVDVRRNPVAAASLVAARGS